MINFHLVWIPKRRKGVLVGDVEKRLREIIWDTCKEKDWQIIALEIMPDHVHLFVNVLRKEFPHLLKLPSLWTHSYFVSTAGNVSNETIRRYIEEQRHHDVT